MNFFDEMAGVWNKTCRYDTGRIEKVLSVLQLKQGDTVLDIGTGTGVMIPFIREQVGHYAPIVAVDSSEKMLREASLRFPMQEFALSGPMWSGIVWVDVSMLFCCIRCSLIFVIR